MLAVSCKTFEYASESLYQKCIKSHRNKQMENLNTKEQI